MEEWEAGPRPVASKHASGVEVLGGRTRKQLARHKGEDETVRFCLAGVNGQAIVALDERLLVIKPGWEAGAAFGARVTSFHYRDITGIEVNTGLMMGVIEINTPSYQGTGEKDYWSIRNRDRDPRRVTNCLPTRKGMIKEQQPYLEELKNLIRAAKAAGLPEQTARGRIAPPSESGVAGELERLAALRESGALTEEEFAAAKARVIGALGESPEG